MCKSSIHIFNLYIIFTSLYTHHKYHNFMITYSFIHFKYFLKINLNFKDVSWLIEKIMIKFQEKNATWHMCSISTITQVLHIIIESSQSLKKANIYTYNFHVYTDTQF